GDQVYAAWSGKVRYAKYNEGGFGNLVIIRHNNGLETFYGHLSKILVSPNQNVKAGDVIGLGGNTGRSFGSHLHFEVRFYDLPMNPEEVIDFENKQVRDSNLFVHRGLFRPGAKPSHLQQGSGSPSPNSLATASSPASSSTNRYYKVRSGDTLSSIAAKNKTTIAKLCQLNGIKQTTILQVGRNLRVR
ncbi:MAG TPA: M23 family metallopeptidase, partial [Taishania sp.]|nr:M23 family metallopeptidase [Taishania sp.]